MAASLRQVTSIKVSARVRSSCLSWSFGVPGQMAGHGLHDVEVAALDPGVGPAFGQGCADSATVVNDDHARCG